MNISLSDSLLGRQRSRQWTPLITQQFRLRHVHQIFTFNLPPLPKGGSYYFTLHQTSMSAPFYTSEKLESCNPKWPELDQRNLINLSSMAVVVRIWKHDSVEPDSIITTWGVNLSGLVYLGGRVAEIQPNFFGVNSVIFYMRGGYFTSHRAINFDGPRPPPFTDNLNLIGPPEDRKIFRTTSVQAVKSEIRSSYNINKLRRLQSLQVAIKNRSLDVENVRLKIELKCGAGTEADSQEETSKSTNSNVRYAPQLLTMNSLNRMLEVKPTKMQRKEMVKIRNAIELAQFRNKLLSQERDKKTALIRKSKLKLRELVDQNEDKNSELMKCYYELNKQIEKLKEMKRGIVQLQENLVAVHSQLFHRRKQLLNQLLFIYPICRHSETKYTIHGIYLPNSDILSDCSDSGISVALGYATHVLVMCSTFLQVPLRYPVIHYGSRSYITDHISPSLAERDREFPLFTKGKDKIQFTYAVYLLNKNIAQLRWLLFMYTPELKATLPNLLNLLQGHEARDLVPLAVSCLRGEDITVTPSNSSSSMPPRVTDRKFLSRMYRNAESGPGLSEILAIPEAFMSSQISSDSFRNLAQRGREQIVIKERRGEEAAENCDNNGVVIEQGTDMLDPDLNLAELTDDIDTNQERQECVQEPITVETKGSETEEEELEIEENQGEIVEDNVSFNGESRVDEDDKPCWRNEELSSGNVALESPLTVRTDALLNTKSFNLVRPKTNL